MNGYMPMNIHPNPYGQGDMGPGTMPPPENTKLGMSPPVTYSIEPQRLPSRDIPQDTTTFSQDTRTQANYVPPSPAGNYIAHWNEQEEAEMTRRYHDKQREAQATAAAIDLVYLPLLLSVLYFMFQMGIVQRTLYAYTLGLGVYRDDGHLNVRGRVFHSCLFGATALALFRGKDVLERIVS